MNILNDIKFSSENKIYTFEEIKKACEIAGVSQSKFVKVEAELRSLLIK